MHNDGAIVVRGLTKRYDDREVLSGITLAVPRGGIFGFLGPNGSGKSTTIKILCGLVQSDAGEAWIDGLQVVRDAAAVREHIGYMAQGFTLYPDLTGEENMEFYARAYLLGSRERRRRKSQTVECTGVGSCLGMRAGRLSGGWQRRLALACALLHDPPVVFLDEPTAGIDPVARAELWELLRILAARGKTFFITTHYMDEAQNCSQLAYIQNGRILASGCPAEICGTQSSLEAAFVLLTRERPA